MTGVHRVAVLAPHGVYPFELGIPARVLGCADGRYEVLTCTADGGPVTTSADYSIEVKHGPDVLKSADTVVVPPFAASHIGRDAPAAVAEALRVVRPGTRFVSICTGAFVLAAAGLLDARPATTHWASAELFRQWYPAVALNPDVLFIDDGDILTSAGAASGIDVCLHLVRRDLGSEVANRVARLCVVAPWRDGSHSQYIDQPIPQIAGSGTAGARQWALDHLSQSVTLNDMAQQANMSRRTFSRRFTEEVGMTPGSWLIHQRVLRARALLESTDLTVDDVAQRAGFAGGTSLRAHLHAAVGATPREYRRIFRTPT